MSHPKHIVAVGTLVRRADGHCLLVRSPKRGWEFPGGQVEEGEDLVAALRRELREEAGVEIGPPALRAVYSNLGAPPKVMFDFRAAYVSGELRGSEESPELGWFPPERALALVTHAAYAYRLRVLLDPAPGVLYRAYTNPPFEVRAGAGF